MRQVAYFVMPVMAGWIVGSVACLSTMAMVARTIPTLNDLTLTATIAGLLIIAPTYVLFVLPYSFLCRRYFREHNKGFPWWPLCILLIVFGAATTFVPLFHSFGERVSFASSNPAENPGFFFIPFIPYSLLVAWLMSRLTKWSFQYDA
jgi:hypothetical protein